MNSRSISVSKLNNYIKSLFNNDGILNNVSVEGEISNFKHHGSGHLYFSLKDTNSRILCVMFKGNAQGLTFKPEDGKEVVIKGYVSLYEKSGQYQLYAQQMEMKGEGNLYLKFEELKRELNKLGWFDSDKKLAIPLFPKKIAIVTSQTGAAIRDIISVIERRNTAVQLYLYPVLVQGESAKYEISAAIEKINETDEADLIIIGRGGGSIEELWAFNELIVAQSIFSSHIPIISAVGHETDFTISDFVADLRAATPSAAAELAVPSLLEMTTRLKNDKLAINRAMLSILSKNMDRIKQYKNHYIIRRPVDTINQHRQQMDSYQNRLVTLLKDYISKNRLSILNTKSKLNELNPLIDLEKGVITTKDGQLVKSVSQLKVDEILTLRFKDGSVQSKILEINEGLL